MPCEATRAELAQSAREHYEQLSNITCDWYSLIPEAIDYWEREPGLRAELESMTAERDALKDILREVWNQFSIPADDGRRWSGGLSVLDDVREAIE